MTYTLRPRTTMDYAWDCPAARDKKLVLTINKSSRVVDIMEIGNLIPFKFTVSFHVLRDHRPLDSLL